MHIIIIVNLRTGLKLGYNVVGLFCLFIRLFICWFVYLFLILLLLLLLVVVFCVYCSFVYFFIYLFINIYLVVLYLVVVFILLYDVVGTFSLAVESISLVISITQYVFTWSYQKNNKTI